VEGLLGVEGAVVAADADVQVTGQVAGVEGDRLRREALIRGQGAQRLALGGRVDRPEAGVAVPVRVDVVAVDVVRVDVIAVDVIGVDVVGVDVVGVDVVRDERARVDVVAVDVVAVDVVGVDVIRRDVPGRVLPDLRVFACWRIARATIRMSRYRVRLSFAPRFVRSTFTCICGPIGMRYQVDWFALPIPSSMPTPSVSSRALTQVWF